MTGYEVETEVNELELPSRAPTTIPSIWGLHRGVTHRTTGPMEAIPEDETTPLQRVMAFPEEEQAARIPLTPFDILKKGVMRIAKVAFGHRSRFVFVP